MVELCFWVIQLFCTVHLCFGASSVQSTTVRPATGTSSYTFNTIFTPKLCSALTVGDLDHLVQSDIDSIKQIIASRLNANAQCIVTFGVLVIADIPNNGNFVASDWVRLFANTISIIMDKNKDGAVDDAAVGAAMKTRPRQQGQERATQGAYVIGTSLSLESLPLVDEVIGSTTPLTQAQDFKAEFGIGAIMRAMTEEIFHTYQKMLGVAHPTIFGLVDTGCPSGRRLEMNESSSSRSLQECDAAANANAQTGCNYQQSMLTKCAFSAQCNWYTDQICCSTYGAAASGTNVNGGGCLFPSCAALEWYYNLVFQYSETVYPGTNNIFGASERDIDIGSAMSGGVSFPQNRADVTSKLNGIGGDCASFLAAFTTLTYNQPLSPFDWNYAPTGTTASEASPSPSPTPSPQSPTSSPTPSPTRSPTPNPTPSPTPSPTNSSSVDLAKGIAVNPWLWFIVFVPLMWTSFTVRLPKALQDGA